MAGQISSSTPSSSAGTPQAGASIAVPRRDNSGSALAIETSEAMFDIGAALNSCGYDNGLSESLPVRAAIRDELQQAVAANPDAAAARTSLCSFFSEHALNGALNLSQYVSLSLFLTPAPELALAVPETEMPPDALQVDTVLPLLHAFAEATNLHGIWVTHRADYEAAVAHVRDTISRMMLETDVYLHMPASSYDGRRFVVVLEPMLSPNAVNARVYGDDYFVVASPEPGSVPSHNEPLGPRAAGLDLQAIRHVFLLYTIDPLVYSRASIAERMQPILKTVQDAPIPFHYKNDVNAFVTQCLIKAIEARLMDVGFAPPKRSEGKGRMDVNGYDVALAQYEHKADAVRRQQVQKDMRQGWVLAGYFYDRLSLMDREGVSLKENMGELVYGMDVTTEISHAKKIDFYPANSPELDTETLTRGRAVKRTFTPMDQAELALQRGDRNTAATLAETELKQHPDSGAAQYVLARVSLMEGDPQEAVDHFQATLRNSKDARTLAWSHIYLGRLYDTEAQPDRAHAVAEYKAALAVALQPDTRAAAQAGLEKPFELPKREVQAPASSNDDADLDPTGKKQKESYKPSEEATPPAAPAKPQR